MHDGVVIGIIKAISPAAQAESAGKAFEWLAFLTSKRIWNEDVGDAIETICAMERADCSRFKIRYEIVKTYFWVIIVTIRELVAALIKLPLR